jgi:TonB family protein
MKKIIFIFGFLIFSGCSLFQPEEQTVIQPRLLKQAALPPITANIYKDKFEFFCDMVINEKGNVENVKLLTQSGDPTWDSLATQSLLKWKFAPATLNGIPVKLLIRRKVKVLFEKPTLIPLAEIQFSNLHEADSAYNALLTGADFTTLVHKYSISPTKQKNGNLGDVDIKHYANDISYALSKLDEGEFTKPLSYGNSFIIFKRLK